MSLSWKSKIGEFIGGFSLYARTFKRVVRRPILVTEVSTIFLPLYVVLNRLESVDCNSKIDHVFVGVFNLVEK